MSRIKKMWTWMNREVEGPEALEALVLGMIIGFVVAIPLAVEVL